MVAELGEASLAIPTILQPGIHMHEAQHADAMKTCVEVLVATDADGNVPATEALAQGPCLRH